MRCWKPRVRHKTLFHIAGVLLTPLAFLMGVGEIEGTLEETGKTAVLRMGMWAVVIAWFVASVAVAFVVAQAWPSAEPEAAGIAALVSFFVPLVVGPLVTWTWLRRRLR